MAPAGLGRHGHSQGVATPAAHPHGSRHARRAIHGPGGLTG